MFRIFSFKDYILLKSSFSIEFAALKASSNLSLNVIFVKAPALDFVTRSSSSHFP
jgi:hypothetical protein